MNADRAIATFRRRMPPRLRGRHIRLRRRLGMRGYASAVLRLMERIA
jgi:hypothetical protein